MSFDGATAADKRNEMQFRSVMVAIMSTRYVPLFDDNVCLLFYLLSCSNEAVMGGEEKRGGGLSARIIRRRMRPC